MRVKIMFGLILIVAAGVWATDKLQPLNVKLGLWEVTKTITSNGQLSVPPEMLSRLTPEQRARLEERMKAQATDKATTRTYQSCLTKEKLEKAEEFGEEKENCSRTIITSSGHKINLKIECTLGSGKVSGTAEIEATSPDSAKGTAHVTTTSSAGAMNSTINFDAKWIGSACGQVN
jgi:uncharacterized protein DUF3617